MRGRASWSRALPVLALCAALGLVPAARAGAFASEKGAPPLPRKALLERALTAYRSLEASGRVANPLLTVIDYALPSSQRRLWILDPRTHAVLAHEFVAHGRGSSDPDDPARAVRFGNDEGSHRTSLGAFLTLDTYFGQHGLALELEGLEPGVNDRARERRIVIHPADYVSEAFRARSGGWVGRSFGCPALAPEVAGALIERIRGGSVVYAGARGAARHAKASGAKRASGG